ncbi:hypothetical protein [Chryseobacterium hagamense]|uniref:Uncharacterized protein n=1 Tax=Chryseobacterium hagamense TaxID=395935 RepID=A0A511YSD2_9FLAO|nr:hypothetical protein [Chryseobacterium hagamense]GEN78107.1 hypothetical protein CHA01nite_38470 [Chryseobacterium hagamense]
MFKRLLIFFKIIEEVKVPVPMQWRERPPVETPRVVRPTVISRPQPVKKEIRKEAEIVLKEKRPVGNKEKIKDIAGYTKDYKEYCLEKTSNQHILKASGYKVINRTDSTEVFCIAEDAFVTHNEHKMLRLERGYFIKYIQQEYNPITQLNENAYD